jgi:hypothetical protein
VVIAVMAVTFLGQAVSWNGQTDVLGLGGGCARDRRAERLPVDREGDEEVAVRDWPQSLEA